jgi:dipeptidyl aminopeptidase/acylaminoacyl peptidase
LRVLLALDLATLVLASNAAIPRMAHDRDTQRVLAALPPAERDAIRTDPSPLMTAPPAIFSEQPSDAPKTASPSQPRTGGGAHESTAGVLSTAHTTPGSSGRRPEASVTTTTTAAEPIGPSLAERPTLRRRHTIVFASNRTGDYELWSVRTDASLETRLTSDPLADAWPAISPDGNKVVWVRSTTLGGTGHVYVMDLATKQRTQITQQMATYARPRWSPDGSSLAFENADDGSIVITTAAGEPLRVFHSPAPGELWARPTWSPDGELLAVANAQQKMPIAVIRAADGAVISRVGSSRGTTPEWDETGTRLFFDGGGSIFSSYIDGRGLRRYEYVDAGTRRAACWLPDERAFVYMYASSGGANMDDYDIRLTLLDKNGGTLDVVLSASPAADILPCS